MNQRKAVIKRIGVPAVWSYLFSVGILGLVGLFESGRICSALPDWASAMLIPTVPFVGSTLVGYLSEYHGWRERGAGGSLGTNDQGAARTSG